MTSTASNSSPQPPITITNADQIEKLEDVANMINLSIGATGKGILIGLLSALGSAILICVVLACFYFFRYTPKGRILLDRMGRPGEYDDEQAFAKEEAEALEEMDDIHRTEYMRAKGTACGSSVDHACLLMLSLLCSVHTSEPAGICPDRYLAIAISRDTGEGGVGLGI